MTARLDLGPYVEDHIDAMVRASNATEVVAVLRSAITKHLGGQRVLCQSHRTDMSLDELVNHTASYTHEIGDIIPSPPDPRELGRGGETAAAL